jgi:hypothetical protein
MSTCTESPTCRSSLMHLPWTQAVYPQNGGITILRNIDNYSTVDKVKIPLDLNQLSTLLYLFPKHAYNTHQKFGHISLRCQSTFVKQFLQSTHCYISTFVSVFFYLVYFPPLSYYVLFYLSNSTSCTARCISCDISTE